MSGFMFVAALNVIVLPTFFMLLLLTQKDGEDVIRFMHSKPLVRTIASMFIVLTLITNLMVASFAFSEVRNSETHQEE